MAPAAGFILWPHAPQKAKLAATGFPHCGHVAAPELATGAGLAIGAAEPMPAIAGAAANPAPDPVAGPADGAEGTIEAGDPEPIAATGVAASAWGSAGGVGDKACMFPPGRHEVGGGGVNTLATAGAAALGRNGASGVGAGRTTGGGGVTGPGNGVVGPGNGVGSPGSGVAGPGKAPALNAAALRAEPSSGATSAACGPGEPIMAATCSVAGGGRAVLAIPKFSESRLTAGATGDGGAAGKGTGAGAGAASGMGAGAAAGCGAGAAG